jgi:hypothetical protein
LQVIDLNVLGILVLGLFLLVLIWQFIAMILHCFGTFLVFIAKTSVGCKCCEPSYQQYCKSKGYE